MARKKKSPLSETASDEEAVALLNEALKPRKKRAGEPAALSEVLESSPAIKAILDARGAKSLAVESEDHHDTPLPPENPNGPIHERNGKPNEAEPPFEPTTPSFAAKVRESAPIYRPVPEDFFPAWRDAQAGIRVHKRTNRNGSSTVAIQFSDNHQPTRAEKDILEAIHEPDPAINERIKFTYKTADSMWERDSIPGDPPGANTIDGVRLAQELAAARVGRGR